MTNNSLVTIRNDTVVGMFDSGLGGLSVLREIRKREPHEKLLYLADHAHCPYGTRTLAEVQSFAMQIARWLCAEGAKLIAVACNTASAAALHSLRETFPGTPFVGMDPAVKPAVGSTNTGTVGVLATEATIKGKLFGSLLDRYADDATVLTQACPGLVELVEKEDYNSSHTRTLLKRYAQPLLDLGADTLVLGCTHYSFLKAELQDIVGSNVAIIDPAPAVADQVTRVLTEKSLRSKSELEENPNLIVVCTTDSNQAGRLSRQAQSLLGEPVQLRIVELN